MTEIQCCETGSCLDLITKIFNYFYANLGVALKARLAREIIFSCFRMKTFLNEITIGFFGYLYSFFTFFEPSKSVKIVF